MTAPAYIKTGKENALYSLYKGVQNQFSGWTGNLNPNALTVSPISYNQTMQFPVLTIQDVGGPSLGAFAMGRNVAEGYKGYEEQTQVEFDCYDQNVEAINGTSAYGSADQNVRRMRDVLKDYLENAGQTGLNGQPIYPSITLIDGNNGDADTGSSVWYQQEDTGTWSETFLENISDMVNVKRYRIYARIRWHRFTSTPAGND